MNFQNVYGSGVQDARIVIGACKSPATFQVMRAVVGAWLGQMWVICMGQSPCTCLGQAPMICTCQLSHACLGWPPVTSIFTSHKTFCRQFLRLMVGLSHGCKEFYLVTFQCQVRFMKNYPVQFLVSCEKLPMEWSIHRMQQLWIKYLNFSSLIKPTPWHFIDTSMTHINCHVNRITVWIIKQVNDAVISD